jgi:hypothetical protein
MASPPTASESYPEDPLERLERMAAEEDEAAKKTEAWDSSSEDPLERLERMAAEEDEAAEKTKVMAALPTASESYPEDPLERLERMAAEEEEAAENTEAMAVPPIASEPYPEDPLERLERMAAEEDEAAERSKAMAVPPIATELYPEDPLERLERMAAEEDEAAERTKAMAVPPIASESYPEDPLERLERMAAEEDEASEKTKAMAVPPTALEAYPEDPLDRLDRMAAEEDESSVQSGGRASPYPEDPLERLDRMAAGADRSSSQLGGRASPDPKDPLARLERIAAEADELSVPSGGSASPVPDDPLVRRDLMAAGADEPSVQSGGRASPMALHSYPEDPLERLDRIATENSGGLLPSPESNSLSIYEDSESKEMPTPTNGAHALSASPGSRNNSGASPEEYPVTAEAYRVLSQYSSATNLTKETQSPSNSFSQNLTGADLFGASFDQSSVSGEFAHQSGSRSQTVDNDNFNVEARGSALLPGSPEQDKSYDDMLPQYDHGMNIDVSYQDDQFESSDSEESDRMIRKKDFRDLDSMIQSDDLEALEAKAALIAESVKAKLTDSRLADLSGESRADTTIDGYPVTAFSNNKLAVGGKETGSNQGINELDISKISSDHGERYFVSMSDSILDDSPLSIDGAQEEVSDGILYSAEYFEGSNQINSNTDPRSSRGIRTAASAGESSGRNIKDHEATTGSQFSMQDVEEEYVTQKAGEPSQGDWRDIEAREYPTGVLESSKTVDGNRRYNDQIEYNDHVYGHRDAAGEQAFGGNGSATTPKQTESGGPMFETDEVAKTSELDTSQVNTSYSISDWFAVGTIASVLADSDSQSNSSYSESYNDSVSSLEATTRASALDTPLANELDKLVGKMDWDGVKVAAEHYETSRDKNLSAIEEKSNPSTIEEKRRKKRELEALKTTLTKGFTKAPGI